MFKVLWIASDGGADRGKNRDDGGVRSPILQLQLSYPVIQAVGIQNQLMKLTNIWPDGWALDAAVADELKDSMSQESCDRKKCERGPQIRIDGEAPVKVSFTASAGRVHEIHPRNLHGVPSWSQG